MKENKKDRLVKACLLGFFFSIKFRSHFALSVPAFADGIFYILTTNHTFSSDKYSVIACAAILPSPTALAI